MHDRQLRPIATTLSQLRLLRPAAGLTAAACLLALMLAAGAGALRAQSSTTGFVAGVITDASGAAVPNAKVTLLSPSTGSHQVFTTGLTGAYRFSFVAPGTYTVQAGATGFRLASQPVSVAVGQAATANFRLALATATQTVTVEGGAQELHTQTADVSTNISVNQVENLPNPGQDLTALAQLSPGAIMNTQGGSGSNFSMYGLPSTGNLMTLNGMDITNMYNNNNQSGASNLSLGLNEITTATVVSNAYSGQNGHMAGSQVEYVTKSGSNQWHGDAVYDWNGRVMNANDYFNNAFGTKRPFDNVNQWAADLGGPVFKNKTFFYVDQEGARVVLPTSARVLVPSPQFQAATLANLQANSPASVPLYKQFFSVYNGAPGASSAQNTLANGGCGSFKTLGAGVPCVLQFVAAPNSLTTEWILAWRIDQVIGNSDRVFVRFQTDHGFRVDSTSPFTPALNIQGDQPEWQGQLSETHTFSAQAVNEFVAGFRWISVMDGVPNFSTALGLVPFELRLSGGAFSSIGTDNEFLTGRHDLLYEYGDNYAYTHGTQTFRFGANMRRDIFTDHLGGNAAGTATATLSGFYSGQAQTFTQFFSTANDLPLTIYNDGGYAEDDWRVNNKLNVTLTARFEHNSSPVCRVNCFGVLTSPFESLDHDAAQPFNAAIDPSGRSAYFQNTAVSFLPRIGFNWSPFASSSTVISGGFGEFTEGLPGQIAADLAQNPPNARTFTASGSIAPAAANSAQATLAADNQAYTSGFANGSTLAQMQAAVPGFAPPNMYTAAPMIKDSIYREWNLEVQHALGADTAFSLNYVGNSGVNESYFDRGVNAYCPSSACSGGFNGLPTAPTDPRFATVSELMTNGRSNYNGLTFALRHRVNKALTLTATYTYGHALDDVSNGGVEGFNEDTNSSILAPQYPGNIAANYGDADYDVRHSINVGYVWLTPHNVGNRALSLFAGDWTVAGTVFAHTGFPFTVIDSGEQSLLAKYNNSGGPVFANYLGGNQPTCSVDTSCLDASDFSAPTSGFGQQQRNQFRGPGFFDTDLSLNKDIPVTRLSESAQFSFGVQFFNLFNHPNFDQPVADFSSSEFGQTISTVSVPTSPLGVYLGGDASPRIVEIQLKLSF
ncbi:MAG: carboxypeptidase regulatory-like domain-containing protein [Terriglobales bacterium]